MSLVPDMIEPIVGWRTWNAQGYKNQTLLGSLVWNEIWQPGRVMQAECVRQARSLEGCCCGKYFLSQIPLGCTCGIYAHRTYQQLLAARPNDKEFYRYPLWSSAIIHGEVNLWGRVIQGKKGYRAQYAYPKKLFVHAYIPKDLARCEKLASDLSELYNVPPPWVR